MASPAPCPVPPPGSVESRPLDCNALLDIVERAMHASPAEWLFFRELRLGTGRRNASQQRVDAFALNTLPHTALKRVCYEVKVSRADFLLELKQPLKRKVGMRYSNEFYFVTPPDLVFTREIPPECGLIEAGYATPEQWRVLFRRHAGFFHFDPASRSFCMISIPAPWRDSPGPTWQLAAAMVRNSRVRLIQKPLPPPAQQRLTLE